MATAVLCVDVVVVLASDGRGEDDDKRAVDSSEETDGGDVIETSAQGGACSVLVFGMGERGDGDDGIRDKSCFETCVLAFWFCPPRRGGGLAS